VTTADHPHATLSSVAGDASKISTRIPPAEDLLKTDYATAVGKKPIVITFATPLAVQSRVCGPVVDVVEAGARGDQVRRPPSSTRRSTRTTTSTRASRPNVGGLDLPTSRGPS